MQIKLLNWACFYNIPNCLPCLLSWDTKRRFYELIVVWCCLENRYYAIVTSQQRAWHLAALCIDCHLLTSALRHYFYCVALTKRSEFSNLTHLHFLQDLLNNPIAKGVSSADILPQWYLLQNTISPSAEEWWGAGSRTSEAWNRMPRSLIPILVCNCVSYKPFPECIIY